jgi:hypothetical protein
MMAVQIKAMMAGGRLRRIRELGGGIGGVQVT